MMEVEGVSQQSEPIPSEGEPVRRSTGNSQKPSLLQRRSSGSHPCLSLCDAALKEVKADNAPKPEEEIQAHFRGWYLTGRLDASAFSSRAVANGSLLTVMSYNILASKYVSTRRYPGCPSWALQESYRLTNIINEIMEITPDLLFLQELPCDVNYTTFAQKLCEERYFQSFHVSISGRVDGEAATSSPDATSVQLKRHSDAEGVAVYFNRDRFHLIEEYPMHFNVIASRDPLLQMPEKRRVSIASHNVAAIVVLRDRLTSDIFICACIHGFYDTAKPECQLYQLVKLLGQIESMKQVYDNGDYRVRVIWGGDLNAEPNSPAVSYVLNRRISVPQAFPGLAAAEHSLELHWMYEDYFKLFQSHVTSAGGQDTWCGIVDYLFYEPDAADVLAVGQLDEKKAIPDVRSPSDHYPICARLILKD